MPSPIALYNSLLLALSSTHSIIHVSDTFFVASSGDSRDIKRLAVRIIHNDENCYILDHWQDMAAYDLDHYIVISTFDMNLFMRRYGLEVYDVSLNLDYDKTKLSDKINSFIYNPASLKIWEELFDLSNLVDSLFPLFGSIKDKAIKSYNVDKKIYDKLFFALCSVRIASETKYIFENKDIMSELSYKSSGYNTFLEYIFQIISKTYDPSMFPFIKDIDRCSFTDDILYLKNEHKGQKYDILKLTNTFEWYGARMDSYCLGSLFERLISSSNRKGKGIFYTPEKLARKMSSCAISRYFHSMTNKDRKMVFCNGCSDSGKMFTVLDPSCGSGHFLCAAIESMAYRIWHFYICIEKKEIDNPFEKLSEIFVSKCLYGVDIDNGALDIAKSRIILLLARYSPSIAKSDYLRRIKLNIFCGDSLIGATVPLDKRENRDSLKYQKNKCIHKACCSNYNETCNVSKSILDAKIQKNMAGTDSKIMYFHWVICCEKVMSNGGFTIILGNPPYGKLKNLSFSKIEKKTLSSLYKKYFPCTTGNIDYYRLFIDRALTLLTKEGVLSLVVPAMFWGDKESLYLRKILFKGALEYVERYTVCSTRSLFNNSITYEVSVFLYCNKQLPLPTDITISLIDGHSDSETQNIARIPLNIIHSDSSLLRIPSFSNMDIEYPFYEYLQRYPKFAMILGDEGHIFVGKLDETVHKHHLCEKKTGHMAIASNHIKDWYVDNIPRNGKKRWVKDWELFVSKRLNKKIVGTATVRELMNVTPKLIGRQMVNRAEKRKLHFSLHYGTEVLTNGVRIIIPDKKYTKQTPKLLAFLNSSLYNWYYTLFSYTYNVKPYELMSLPLPDGESVDSFDSVLVEYIMALSWLGRSGLDTASYVRYLEELLNDSIFELFVKEPLIEQEVLHDSDVSLSEMISSIVPSLGGPKNAIVSVESSKNRCETVSILIKAVKMLKDEPDICERQRRLHAHPWNKLLLVET